MTSSTYGKSPTVFRSWTARFGVLAVLGLFLAGCAGQNTPLDQDRLDYSHLSNATATENERLEMYRAQERLMERQHRRPKPKLEPMAPAYNPLDEAMVSVTMHNQPLHDVLYVVARNAGLNLVIEPDISLDNRITISFEQAPSSVVVENLLKAYDLGYEVQDNVLYVKRFLEKTFELGFLNLRSQVAIDNGGDIYGSTGSDAGDAGDSDLKGNFQIATSLGKGVEESSLYDFIRTNVIQILGIEGVDSIEARDMGSFTLDPVGGRFYVRTTPRRMEAVNKMITDLRNKMSKQVVIDARILEVELKDEYYLGVQWNYVFNKLINGVDTTFGLGTMLFDSDNNLITILPEDKTATPGAIQGGYQEVTGEETLQATVQALQEFGGVKAISNPHLRARHGQPALITSGTTQTYVQEITREVDNETNDVTITMETAKAFSGIMLGVYPFINDEDDIDLQIFPIKSDVDLSRTQSFEGGNSITLPVVDVQNVLTSLHVRDGDTIILGGLIDKGHDKTDGGVPGLMSIPLLGNVFRNESRVESVKELVIIMNIRLIG